MVGCYRCRIFLLAPRHNVEHPIRQRPLQLQRLDRLAFKPEVELPSRGRDQRHGFGTDGRDECGPIIIPVGVEQNLRRFTAPASDVDVEPLALERKNGWLRGATP
jgi:hypothetical protein